MKRTTLVFLAAAVTTVQFGCSQLSPDRSSTAPEPPAPVSEATRSGAPAPGAHSDSTLVMRLPKEKIIFTVDWIPVGSLPRRGMIDSYPIEWEASLKKVLAMDWQRLIPGHPGQPDGRLGTKEDAQKILAFLQDASAEVQKAAREGKCWDAAEKEVKLAKYASVPGYQAALPLVVHRYCGLWGRGT